MVTASFLLLVLVTFVTLTAAAFNIMAPFALKALAPARPEARSHLLLLLIAAPWLVGCGLMFSSLADLFFGSCEFSRCLWNENPADVNPYGALIAVPLALALIVAAAFVIRQFIVSRLVISTLENTCAADPMDVRVVPSDVALAFAGNGRIYVSRAVQEKLSPEQYRAVVLHEQAHLQRHDGIFQIIASIFSACYLPPLRRRLLDALALANEQACDDRAAALMGRETTASAILAVEQMNSGGPLGVSHCFADRFVAARVERLLHPGAFEWRVAVLRTIIPLGIVFTFFAANVLYYVTFLILYPLSL